MLLKPGVTWKEAGGLPSAGRHHKGHPECASAYTNCREQVNPDTEVDSDCQGLGVAGIMGNGTWAQAFFLG